MTTLDTSGKVIQGWDPEDSERWDSKIAWRTLWISTFVLIIGFATWYLVSAIAPQLNQIGFDISKSQLYWLTAIPGLACGIFRLIFMFLPPIIGTRKLVFFSSLLFIIPMLGWFFCGAGYIHPVLVAARPVLHFRHRRRRIFRIHAVDRLLLPQALVRHRPWHPGRHW